MNQIVAKEIGRATYIIPDEMPKFDMFDLEGYRARNKFTKEGMFAFVSWKWVNPFVDWIGNRKCLEVMAGRGILSLALRQKGVNIITTDDFSWARNYDTYKTWNDTVTEVIEMDAVDSVEQYGNDIDILIMSWAYMDDTAYRVIKKLHEVNLNAQVVYIGEGRHGCTADENFFDHFEEIEDKSFENVEQNFERWRGLYDSPMLGKYKEQTKTLF